MDHLRMRTIFVISRNSVIQRDRDVREKRSKLSSIRKKYSHTDKLHSWLSRDKNIFIRNWINLPKTLNVRRRGNDTHLIDRTHRLTGFASKNRSIIVNRIFIKFNKQRPFDPNEKDPDLKLQSSFFWFSEWIFEISNYPKMKWKNQFLWIL